MPELELSYRRLLLAYPRFYRRERGLEILTTLMDAAEPGQTRPSRAEAMYLLLIGLRYRFVPPTRVSGIASFLVALWVAVVFSAAGAFAVLAVDSPRQPHLAPLGDRLIGVAPVDMPEVGDFALWEVGYFQKGSSDLQDFTVEGWAGARPLPSGDLRAYDVPSDLPGVLRGAYQRLGADGWRLGVFTTTPNSPDGVFWAQRGDALIRVGGSYEHSQVTVRTFPVEPSGVTAGAIAGFLLGGLLAWQAMTWLTHRAARTSPATRRRLLILALPALIACAMNTLDNVLGTIPDWETSAGLFGSDLTYSLGNEVYNPLAPAVVGLTLLGVLVLLREATPLDRFRPLNQPAEG